MSVHRPRRSGATIRGVTVGNVDFMIPKTIERIARVVGKRSGPDRVFHYLPFCFAAARMMLWTQTL